MRTVLPLCLVLIGCGGAIIMKNPTTGETANCGSDHGTSLPCENAYLSQGWVRLAK
jgi:hypothetical protein